MTGEKPVKPDAFAVLGLTPRFDLDAAELRRAYLQRSAELHPDRAESGATHPTAGGADGDVPGDVDLAAAELNQAKATLEDPEKRAVALLELLGGLSKEADRTLPAGFLMEMMETRQQIDAELEGRRGEEREALLEKWDEWADARRARHIAKVAELFREILPRGTPAASALKAIRMELNAWRYTERLLEQLHAGDGL